MKYILTLALAVLMTACERPPDFVDVNGVGHRYSDFDGKWVVVNYWATWCGPCIKEIPELNRLASEHSADLVVLGVNFDAPEPAEAKQQADRMKIEFPVYLEEPAARLGIEKPEVLPTTFIFAPGLELRETLIGPQTEASLLALIGG